VRANSLYAFAVRCGIFNMDEYRHAIERMEPRHYLAAGYYERSLTGMATLFVEKGFATRQELEQRAQGVFPLAAPCAPGRTNAITRERFEQGDRVRVRDEYVPGHVRMPASISIPRCTRPWNRGGAGAHVRRALSQRGSLAEFI
jgi:nitrile hydratase